MKKYILISFILIIIFIIGSIMVSNKKITVENKFIKNNNIEINYPFFNNKIIDKNIWKYLNTKFIYKKENIYLDYDYQIKDDYINILFYFFSTSNGTFKELKKNININKKNGKITNNIKKESIEKYDIITNKKINTNKKMIALSFDDGPNYNTSKVIDILNKYNVKATFFVLGSKVEENEEILKKMSLSGMEIGNHTYSHKLLTKLTSQEIKDEITKTNELIYKYTNKYPTLVRPSYGSITKKIKENVPFPLIIWNIDTLDWKYHNSNKITNKIINKVKDGDIILMHDIYSSSVNAINKVIPLLLKEEYQIVTVSELFYYKSITLEKGKIYSHAT